MLMHRGKQVTQYNEERYKIKAKTTDLYNVVSHLMGQEKGIWFRKISIYMLISKVINWSWQGKMWQRIVHFLCLVVFYRILKLLLITANNQTIANEKVYPLQYQPLIKMRKLYAFIISVGFYTSCQINMNISKEKQILPFIFRNML